MTNKELQHFKYLDELRESGEVNMFEAARYLAAAFPEDFPGEGGFYSPKSARKCLSRWMESDRHEEASRG